MRISPATKNEYHLCLFIHSSYIKLARICYNVYHALKVYYALYYYYTTIVLRFNYICNGELVLGNVRNLVTGRESLKIAPKYETMRI